MLPRADRDAVLDAAAEELMRGAAKELVADWKPYDGEVVLDEGDEVTVHLAVVPRDESLGSVKRTVEWRLARDGGRWKAWSWSRIITEGELRPERRGLRGVEKVTLSDGSVVIEREPEPLGHLPTTDAELAARIDRLYRTMIDLDLTREGAAARRELVAIGKPAVPILLTGIYEIPLETRQQTIQVNMIVDALRSITGQSFGWEPMVSEGSGVGTTEERRNSAIRQWFAWWYKKGNRFEVAEKEDALEELMELTDEERRWNERHKDD